MALNRLSHNLFASVVNFLSLNDFLALSCVCRKFYKTIQSDVRLFLREYLKTFFPKELNYFYEFSEDMTFQLKFFGKASERFFKMSQNFFWKEALIDKTNIQKKWLALLTFNSKNENTIECFNSINKIDEALYNPYPPSLLMIRENFGRYCQTTIQRKILENSLYDDTQILENYCEEELFLSFLKEKSFTFDESEKNLLLQMRWYIFEKNSNLLEPSFKNPLLQIYQLIIETVTNHLASISEYLNSFDSPLYFLQEYCVFWLRYSFSIFELERIFKDFTKIMNQSYETQFPGMPSFPKFSIWRMMIKIWMSVLFETNEKKLLEAFEISINDLRSQNKIDLFRNYTFYERSSIQKDNFYKNNKIALRSLIHNFFECLTDASVNELTIHHLGHSEIRLSNPFIYFENKFKILSEEYYNELSKFYQDDLLKLGEILMEDVQMFKDIINEKMIKSLKKCQYKTWLNCFSEVLQCQFQKCLLSPKKNKKKIIKSEKIIPIFENMKEAVNFTHNCNKIKPHNEFFLKRLQKNLSKKYGKTIIDTFKKYKTKNENVVDKKKKKDLEIEEFFDLKKLESLPNDIFDFYDFSKQTNLKNLKKFHK